MEDLQTIDIEGVELLHSGRHNGRVYTGRELDDAVAAYHALRGVYRAPLKLGHDDGQKLAQADGYPAIGWVENLRRVGTSLVGDFKNVPAKLGALIRAGAYRERSVEVWFSTRFEGVAYPVVIKAVALLGADPPAVSSMQDMVALYSKQDTPSVMVALSAAAQATAYVTLTEAPMPATIGNHLTANLSGAFSFDAIRAAVQDALEDKYPPPPLDAMGEPVDAEASEGLPSCCIRDLYDDAVIVIDNDGDTLYRIPYTLAPSGVATLGSPEAVMVAYQGIPIPVEPDDAQLSLADAADTKTQAASASAISAQIQSDLADVLARLSSVAAGKPGVAAMRTYLSEVLRKLKGMKLDSTEARAAVAKNSRDEETAMELSKFASILGLPATATEDEVTQAAMALKATHVSLSDQTRLVEEVAQLKLANAQRDAKDLIATAKRDGKLAPAQESWALEQCLSNREAFEKYLEVTPKMSRVDLTERGSAGDAEAVPASEAERKIARELGITEDRLTRTPATFEQRLKETQAQRAAELEKQVIGASSSTLRGPVATG